MLRRLFALLVACLVCFAALPTGTARAQEDGSDDEETPEEIVYYGDTELIESLRTYGLLNEWIEASPVSPQASVLLVTGNGRYLAQRQDFLNSLEAWADRTALVRSDLARLDAAQANNDELRSLVARVREALVLDDRLAFPSRTLIEINEALGRLAAVQLPEQAPGELEQSEEPLLLAEALLRDLWELTEIEFDAINGAEPAVTSSGTQAFVGYEELWASLHNVDQLIARGRELIKPAREQSERLLSSTRAQIPSLHAARMLGSSDVGGLSLVTFDAYLRGAARASCSVDWALLAGIGKIESNHGRLGGASVSGSGQVSTTIFGPLLDGGQSEREVDEDAQIDDRWLTITEVVVAARQATRAAFENSLWGLIDSHDDDGDAEEEGNGFAVVVDSDGGRLDENDQWDRAVGPMQFLPETWSKWATDGNGDGVSDPHNLYDAAAAAGRFLCDLSATRGPSPSTFVLGYNSSTSYVRSVLATAQGLRSKPLPVV